MAEFNIEARHFNSIPYGRKYSSPDGVCDKFTLLSMTFGGE
jgi:hypothetical protein